MTWSLKLSQARIIPEGGTLYLEVDEDGHATIMCAVVDAVLWCEEVEGEKVTDRSDAEAQTL